MKFSLNFQINTLLITQVFIISATSMSQPFWPVIIEQQIGKHSDLLYFWSTVVYAIPLLATMFSAPLWGSWADRVGYKKMVLRASFGLFITQGLIVLIKDPLYVTFCLLLQGIFCGFIATAQALGIKMVTFDKQTRIIANLQSATALGTLLGPILGGLAMSYFNYLSMFISSSIICLICAIVLFITIKEPLRKEIGAKKKSNSIDHLEKHCKWTFTAIFLAQVARFMMTPVFAFFVLENLSGNNMQLGLLYAASGAMLFIFSPIWGKLQSELNLRKSSPYFYITFALMISAILLWWLGDTHNFYVALAIRLAWGVALAAILPLLFATLVIITDNSNKGKVIGYGNSANKLGNLVGLLLGSLCAQYFGVASTVQLIGFIYLLNFIFLLLAKTRFNSSLIKNETSAMSN